MIKLKIVGLTKILSFSRLIGIWFRKIFTNNYYIFNIWAIFAKNMNFMPLSNMGNRFEAWKLWNSGQKSHQNWMLVRVGKCQGCFFALKSPNSDFWRVLLVQKIIIILIWSILQHNGSILKIFWTNRMLIIQMKKP